MRRLEAIVSGKVQRVGFRDFVRREASSRGIVGYVRNGADGMTVEVVAEGDAAALTALLDALHHGPRFARVERVDHTYSEAPGTFASFIEEP